MVKNVVEPVSPIYLLFATLLREHDLTLMIPAFEFIGTD